MTARKVQGLLLLVAGLALIAGWGGAKVRRVRTCLDSGLRHLHTLEALSGAESLALPGLADLGTDLHGLQDDLACLRAEGRPALAVAPLLGWLPGVGSDLAAAPDLLEMAQASADGGAIAFDALTPLLQAVQGGGLDLPAAVAALDAAHPALAQAEGALARAVAVRERIDAARLSPRVAGVLDRADRALPLLYGGVQAARLAPELVGARAPRTYLVLAQNDDERRPTGGWITGAGLIALDGGRATSLGFRDSFAIDNLQVPHDRAPESMLRTLWAEMWLFRDANWSPDFPTAAQVAERIVAQDRAQVVDGVVAVDQAALRLLVGEMEPLTVPSSAEPITAANLPAVIRRAWAEPQPGLTAAEDWREWEAHRKDFMAELVAAMLDRALGGGPPIDPARLAAALWRALHERHVLIYVHDPAAAALLAARRWDGALLETDGDYVQVVDANVGFNKVDPSVLRDIEYRVDLGAPAQPRAEATVRYRNEGPPESGVCVQGAQWEPTYEERMAGCFWNYVRFYAAPGARLLDAVREPLPAGSLLARHRFVNGPLGDAGPMVEPEEKNKPAFGLFFVLAPGEERPVSMAWRLPPAVVRDAAGGRRYRLLVQKQSGSPAIPLRVAIALPPGVEVVRSIPEPAGRDGRTLVYEMLLSGDQEIELVFR